MSVYYIPSYQTDSKTVSTTLSAQREATSESLWNFFGSILFMVVYTEMRDLSQNE